MISWREVDVQEQIRNDRMAQAEQARMVRFVRAKKESIFKKFFIRVMKRIGSKFISWGGILLERVDKLSLVSREQSSQINL